MLTNQKHPHYLFGIPHPSLFNKAASRHLCSEFMGQAMQTPIGPAAGPHTQLAQNIVASWLCGAGYIELKTVQDIDNISVSKPCIDMQDEGYNCEWSQELDIRSSFSEYLKAWILIHILSGDAKPEVVFNMSIGYNLDGIRKSKVQGFLDSMQDCSEQADAMCKELKQCFPGLHIPDIPQCISNNVTLSTMHGCPPDEIESIGIYLISERKLNTLIKLNPTLLGSETLRDILNHKLKFRTEVPDEAFDHDLKWDDAINIIAKLRSLASETGVFFGVKVSNTLESINRRKVFAASEKMHYMSGRALHPLSMRLAAQLQQTFEGRLHISFAGGADAFNIVGILKTGICPVTICSDLLKPGGYQRLWQYCRNMDSEFSGSGYSNFAARITEAEKIRRCNKAATEAESSGAYKKFLLNPPSIKGSKPLKHFDCIHAPCINKCPSNQDIPGYLRALAGGDSEEAMRIILKTNPLPYTCGMVCDHACHTKCTRIHYERNIKIREVKRFIAAESSEVRLSAANKLNTRVAVVGAGPAGLSCSYYLALAGVRTTVYETSSVAGGMVSAAIPRFRLKKEALEQDIERIRSLGVQFEFNSRIDALQFQEMRKNFDYVFVAIGAQKAARLNIEGNDLPGVTDPLDYLRRANSNQQLPEARNVVVIGGGNTAMDVARTVMHKSEGKCVVSIVYRRGIEDMPAAPDEIAACQAEGVRILELLTPVKILGNEHGVSGLICKRMRAGDPDNTGRRIPLEIPGSEFAMECDLIIPAVGQEKLIDFCEPGLLQTGNQTLETSLPGVFAGGDVHGGPANIISAIADGKKAAEEILSKAGINEPAQLVESNPDEISARMFRKGIRYTPGFDDNSAYQEYELSHQQAVVESERCLGCDELCSICVTVCPNRANVMYSVENEPVFLQKAVINPDREIVFCDDITFTIVQKYQVFNLADFCNECGNCTTFCPAAGKPFADKPRFFMDLEKFRNASDGFFLNSTPEKIVLIKKRDSKISTLSLKDSKYYYENEMVMACFIGEEFDMIHVRFYEYDLKEYTFEEAAEMRLLMKTFSWFAGSIK